MHLPEFVPPMLAKLVKRPFDSDDFLFEIKWDGMRTLAFVEEGGYRLRNRQKRDLFVRYPDLEFLGELPPGTLLDGELVVLRDSRPDFHLMMRREHARNERRIAQLARELPVTYVVFDLLYHEGSSIMDAALAERRDVLEDIVQACGDPRLVFSQGVIGAGTRFFEEVTKLRMEGVVAKHLESSYLPGQRTDSWQKIKKSETLYCAVVGFSADESGSPRSLVIAAEKEGELRCVGRVGSGLTAAHIAELERLLRPRIRDEPIVECNVEGTWVDPGVFCVVEYLEETPEGHLRAPVFRSYFVDEGR